MDSDQAIATLFQDTHELEGFFHSFIGQLAKRKLKADEDVTHLAAEMKLKVPAALKGVKITWAGAPDTNTDGKEQVMTLARPSRRGRPHHRLHQDQPLQGLPRMRVALLPRRHQGHILD